MYLQWGVGSLQQHHLQSGVSGVEGIQQGLHLTVRDILACEMRHESGQNNQLMEEGAWMLIILFPVICPMWHDKQSKWMDVR